MNKFIISATLLLFTSGAWATDFGKCNSLFPKNSPPTVNSSFNTKHTRALCFDDFAVLYSADTKTPVYAVERLNYLALNNKVKRTNHFHEEPMLSISERSTLKDYNHSGYDRGHMAPAADRRNELAMENSFSLSNMCPQRPVNNRKAFAKIEKDTRTYVLKRSKGDVYVFTGPYYASSSPKTIGPNRVAVPDYFFKVVYDNGTGKSWVHWIANTDEAKPSAPITYEEFVKKTGLNLLNK